MFSVKVGYPSAEEEERIIMETTQDAPGSRSRFGVRRAFELPAFGAQERR